MHVTRDLYFSAVTAWLDQKAVYFATYKTFCGVGTIDFERPTPRPGHVRLRIAERVKSVLAYDAAAFVVEYGKRMTIRSTWRGTFRPRLRL